MQRSGKQSPCLVWRWLIFVEYVRCRTVMSEQVRGDWYANDRLASVNAHLMSAQVAKRHQELAVLRLSCLDMQGGEMQTRTRQYREYFVRNGLKMSGKRIGMIPTLLS